MQTRCFVGVQETDDSISHKITNKLIDSRENEIPDVHSAH